jgi:hypothetical protein
MSKLVPNVVDTARIYRSGSWVGSFSENSTGIILTSPFLAFQINKHDQRGRFFADKRMIAQAGGPFFIQWFKERLLAEKHKLRYNHTLLHVDDVEAKDLFSYRTCGFELELNHPTRHNPIALQLVQKAELFALADYVLERTIADL